VYAVPPAAVLASSIVPIKASSGLIIDSLSEWLVDPQAGVWNPPHGNTIRQIALCPNCLNSKPKKGGPQAAFPSAVEDQIA